MTRGNADVRRASNITVLTDCGCWCLCCFSAGRMHGRPVNEVDRCDGSGKVLLASRAG